VRLPVIRRTGPVCTRVLWLLAEGDHGVTVFHRGLREGGPPQGVKVAPVIPDW
jgi:hypothetical protein